MKRNIFCAIFILVNTFAYNYLCGQEIAEIKNVILQSNELNQQREILIYTPHFYNEETLLHYNVFYVFDAQNREMFDFTHSVISFLTRASGDYIVVGITSPYNDSLGYSRNNDMLPKPVNVNPENFYGGIDGNAVAFMKYVKNEVIPYVNSHYRTKNRNVAVGHSLSASFIIMCMLAEPDMFDDYVALSPNFAYDKDRLADNFLNFDFNSLNSERFLYLSHADEETYWTDWKPAREKVYDFLRGDNSPENLSFLINELPETTHWSTFASSLPYGLSEYFKFLSRLQVPLSANTYEVTITVEVPDKNDVVYITGNQSALGNWETDKVKLSVKSDYEREIKLTVQSPMEFKFTKGSWETEGQVEYNEQMKNIWVLPEKNNRLNYKIEEWE